MGHQRNIQGHKYQQLNLDTDLVAAIAGQTILVKLALALLLSFGCSILGIVNGYQGGGELLHIVVGTPYRFVFLIVLLITIVWLTATVVKSWSQGILQLALLTVIALIFSLVISYLDLIKLFPGFAFSLVGNVIIQTGICGFSYASIRFVLAIIEILFSKPKLVNLVIGLLILLTSGFGSQIAFSAQVEQPTAIVRQVLESGLKTSYSEQNLRLVTILGGCSLMLFLLTAAWFTNQLRQVPWNYPDVIRDLALATSSWRGTSFLELDLSNVNFAKARLANTDLRAEKLYRTCFQGVVGLERARVDNQYLDLEYPKVQRLLTHGSSRDLNFQGFNLRGAYLQGADMRGFDLTDTNLTGADLKSTDLKSTDLRGSTLIRTQLAGADFQGVDLRKNILIDANLTEANLRNADLRDCILVRAQVARADFSGADLTGICIEDWSVSSRTNFTNVRCDYIYRRYRNGQRTDRYPVDRNFEPGEFASLFQQPENELELVFKGEEFDYTALSLTFEKLQTDKPDLKLKLQGIEQRQDLWVVKVTSDDPATVESRIKEIQNTVYQGYEVTTTRLENDPLIRKLISDVANAQKTLKETDEEVKQLAKRIGSNFYFVGGTITNVTGAGEIRYTEASNQVRSLVTGDGHETQVVNALLNQLRSSNVATTANEQTELIQLIILEEAQRDPRFRQSLLQQEKQILATLPESSIATAIQGAIAQLNSEGSSSIV